MKEPKPKVRAYSLYFFSGLEEIVVVPATATLSVVLEDIQPQQGYSYAVSGITFRIGPRIVASFHSVVSFYELATVQRMGRMDDAFNPDLEAKQAKLKEQYK